MSYLSCKISGMESVGANVESGNNRAGYDFMINGKLFVDLKISKLTHADNTNCKAGIYHVLTGSSPEDAPDP